VAPPTATGAPVGRVHAERLRANAIKPSTIPGYPAADRALREPTGPPTSARPSTLLPRPHKPRPSAKSVTIRDFATAAELAGALTGYGLAVAQAEVATGSWTGAVHHDGADVTLSVSVVTRL
jgi:hypothetical protein